MKRSKNISPWEGVLVLTVRLILQRTFVVIKLLKNISLWEGVLVLTATVIFTTNIYCDKTFKEYFSLGGCAGPESTVIFTTTLIKRLQNISLWEGVLVLNGNMAIFYDDCDKPFTEYFFNYAND